MRQPSTPTGNNANANKPRHRGAIRTHLGRKRLGPRGRLRDSTPEGVRQAGEPSRREQEELFDRLAQTFREITDAAADTSAHAFDGALDAACESLVQAGQFTAESVHHMRELLRRDLLQRDHPAMTFRTGDITTAGTLTCAGCGWTVRTARSSVLPSCPQCTETAYRKTA